MPKVRPVEWSPAPRYGGTDNWIFPVKCRKCGDTHLIRGVGRGERNVTCCGRSISWAPCDWCEHQYSASCSGCVTRANGVDTITKFRVWGNLTGPVPRLAETPLPSLEES